MPERDFKGVWTPKEVWLNENLSRTEKDLIVEIDSLDQGKGCWASNEYLAKFCGISIGRLKNILVSLRKREYLVNNSFNGRQRFVSVNWNHPEFTKTLPQGSRNSYLRGNEKVTVESEKIPQDSQLEPQTDESATPSNTVSNTVRYSLSPSESSLPTLSEEEPEDWRPPGEEGIDYFPGENSMGTCWINRWGKELKPPKPPKDKIFEKQFMTLIVALASVNPTAGALIRRKVEREGAQTMIDAIGFEKTLGWVKILKVTNSREGFPKITTLSQLALHYSWLRDKYHGK